MIKNIRHQKEDFSKTPYPHNKICETKQENAKGRMPNMYNLNYFKFI